MEKDQKLPPLLRLEILCQFPRVFIIEKNLILASILLLYFYYVWRSAQYIAPPILRKYRKSEDKLPKFRNFWFNIINQQVFVENLHKAIENRSLDGFILFANICMFIKVKLSFQFFVSIQPCDSKYFNLLFDDPHSNDESSDEYLHAQQIFTLM